MSSTMNKVMLMSSDGASFEVDKEVAMQSQTIKNMIEDDCVDNGIPLPNVSSQILSKVIEYCKEHVDKKPNNNDQAAAPANEEDLKAWDAEFIEVDQNILLEIILAANYLDIKSLLDLACQTVADKIKNKQPEEVRQMFGIKNDFTPEEEEAVRNENLWAFE